MGWSIETNNKNQWSIISSVTDSSIAEFNTEKDVVKFIAQEKIYEGKLKAIETLISFPSGWHINGKRVATGSQSHIEYYNWAQSICLLETYGDYYKAIDDKLEELMK